ncbi:hypothetical protein FB446DRAFT_790650 [Lentinula raphanica]|nr:hypothetical protein FB446DRAFT_790650 [Lentinula raphanica]
MSLVFSTPFGRHLLDNEFGILLQMISILIASPNRHRILHRRTRNTLSTPRTFFFLNKHPGLKLSLGFGFGETRTISSSTSRSRIIQNRYSNPVHCTPNVVELKVPSLPLEEEMEENIAEGDSREERKQDREGKREGATKPAEIVPDDGEIGGELAGRRVWKAHEAALTAREKDNMTSELENESKEAGRAGGGVYVFDS